MIAGAGPVYKGNSALYNSEEYSSGHPQNPKGLVEMRHVGFLLSLVFVAGLAGCGSPTTEQTSEPAQAETSQRPSEVVCAAEIKSLCSDVQPGEGRIGRCLSEHRDQWSDDCRAEIQKGREAAQQQKQ